MIDGDVKQYMYDFFKKRPQESIAGNTVALRWNSKNDYFEVTSEDKDCEYFEYKDIKKAIDRFIELLNEENLTMTYEEIDGIGTS